MLNMARSRTKDAPHDWQNGSRCPTMPYLGMLEVLEIVKRIYVVLQINLLPFSEGTRNCGPTNLGCSFILSL